MLLSSQSTRKAFKSRRGAPPRKIGDGSYLFPPVSSIGSPPCYSLRPQRTSTL